MFSETNEWLYKKSFVESPYEDCLSVYYANYLLPVRALSLRIIEIHQEQNEDKSKFNKFRTSYGGTEVLLGECNRGWCVRAMQCIKSSCLSN